MQGVNQGGGPTPSYVELLPDPWERLYEDIAANCSHAEVYAELVRQLAETRDYRGVQLLSITLDHYAQAVKRDAAALKRLREEERS